MDKKCSICGFSFYDLKSKDFDWEHFHCMFHVSSTCPRCGEHLYFSSIVVTGYMGDRINELEEVFHVMRILPLICNKCNLIIWEFSAVCREPGYGNANWIAGQRNMFERN